MWWKHKKVSDILWGIVWKISFCFPLLIEYRKIPKMFLLYKKNIKFFKILPHCNLIGIKCKICTKQEIGLFRKYSGIESKCISHQQVISWYNHSSNFNTRAQCSGPMLETFCTKFIYFSTAPYALVCAFFVAAPKPRRYSSKKLNGLFNYFLFITFLKIQIKYQLQQSSHTWMTAKGS